MELINIQTIDKILNNAIYNKEIPGGVLLVSKLNNKKKYHKSYGHSAIYSDAKFNIFSKPIKTLNDTIYDLASISKVFTSMAILKLCEGRFLDLNSPIHHYIPEFKFGGKDSITIEHLLTHTSGLPSSVNWRELKKQGSFLQKKNIIISEEKINNTGRYLYSDLGMMILGFIIEEITQRKLDNFIKEILLTPLEMENTMYKPDSKYKQRIAATEYQEHTKRDLIWGEVHDEKAWALGGIAGHAGLFSNALDLDKFCHMILQEGTYNNKQIFNHETIELLKSNRISSQNPLKFSLGWDLDKEKYMGYLSNHNTIGHRGYTGTSLIISFNLNLAYILLTNRVHPSRKNININHANILRKNISNSLIEHYE